MKNKYLNIIITFLLVSSTGGLLFVFNRNLSFLIFASVIIFSLFYLKEEIKRSVFYSLVVTFLIVVSLFAINFIFAANPQSLTKYAFFGVTIFTTILTLFYFNNQNNKQAFLNSLYIVLKLILFHSLLSFIAYFFIKENLFLIDSKYHESLTYNYLFYFSAKETSFINLFGIDFIRNSGIFWEPGILQIYLNILFFLEVSMFKRNKWLLLLIILAIISTYSTTGLLLLTIQILYFLQKSFKNTLAIILLFLIGMPLYFVFSANMNEKIYGDRESSFQKRLFDLTQPLFIALEHPITGIGLDIDRFHEVRKEFYIDANINSMLSEVGIEQKIKTTDRGSTNSLMYMLAGMGFPTTILFVFMLLKQQIIKNDKIIWFCIIFLSIMSEPLLFRPFFLIFIISGFSNLFFKIINHKKI